MKAAERGPGGFGTMDELFECLTLIQTMTIRHMPVVLAGDGEWEELLEWLRRWALQDGRIRAGDLEHLHLIAEPSEVCAIVDAALPACALTRADDLAAPRAKRRTSPTAWRASAH